jgi:hypothetical protein
MLRFDRMSSDERWGFWEFSDASFQRMLEALFYSQRLDRTRKKSGPSGPLSSMQLIASLSPALSPD